MIRNYLALNNEPVPLYNYTEWELVIFGENTDVAPETVVKMGRCSTSFYELTHKSERQNDYWKAQVFNQFKSHENDYIFKPHVIWKKLFCDYSNELKVKESSKNRVIESIANHCFLLFNSKDSSIDKAEAYYLLEPIRGILLEPDSNPLAQYFLGKCYFNGYGVIENKEDAFKYYKLSAKQKNANAQVTIGFCYDYGYGVPQDLKKAFKYYKLSATQGNKHAQYNLAICYKNGTGVTADLVEAFKYFKLSADQGYADSQYRLGLMLKNGEGVNQDPELAFKYLKLSADQGNAKAQCLVAYRYYHGLHIDKNPSQAFKYYKFSALQGDAAAQYSLYLCYKDGYGVNQDASEALKYCKLAAEQEFPEAIEQLAELQQSNTNSRVS